MGQEDFAKFINKPCVIELVGDALALMVQGGIPMPVMREREVTKDGQSYSETEFNPLPFLTCTVLEHSDKWLTVSHPVMAFGANGEALAPVKLHSKLNIDKIKAISTFAEAPSSLVMP